MKIPQYHFDKGITIFNIGDIHRGDEACDVDTLHKTINEVKKSGAYWISTGDMLNVAIKTSISDVHNSMGIQKELTLLSNELRPIADKCLGFVGSNHHRRINNATGLDFDKVVANELGIPYLGKLGLINVTCGGASYFVAMHHGTGGGRRRGGKVNNLEDLSTLVPSADVYLEGHTHAYASFINEVPYIDRKRNSLRYYKSHFVTTGHYLLWEDSYAQDYKMRPMPCGSAVIELGHAVVGRNDLKSVKASFFH